MLLAATMELFRRNSLGFNSFALYGLFFTAYAVYNFGVLRGWFFLPTIKGQQALAALMGIASFIFMVASAAICLVLVGRADAIDAHGPPPAIETCH